MHWNTVLFSEVHAAISASGSELNFTTLKELLAPLKPDLDALLTTPPKAEASRSKLLTREITLENEQVKLTDDFLNECARVADELNLDELVAVEIVFYAAKDAKRLRINTFESSIALFYFRRQFILDIYRFCCEELDVSILSEYFSKDADTLVLQIINSLKQVEKIMEDLNEKAKTGEFMGYANNLQFKQLLDLQRGYLVKEHEQLGILLNILVTKLSTQQQPPKSQTLINVLNHVSSFTELDSKIFAYFPALVKWLLSAQSPTFSKEIYDHFTSQTDEHSDLYASSMNSSTQWKAPFKSSLALVFYIGLTSENRETAPIDYFEVCGACKRAIDGGALEFLMSVQQDLNYQLGEQFFERFWPLLRLRVNRLTFWQTLPQPRVLEQLQLCFESIVDGFISNLADILKEMRLSEEDMYLALNESDRESKVAPGCDLERFMCLCASVYRNQPSATKYLDDETSALYGFLLWGRDFQVTFMSTIYTELIASLANSPANCLKVHKFMMENEGLSSAKEDDNLVLCWSNIYSIVDYYMKSPQDKVGTNGNGGLRDTEFGGKPSNLIHPITNAPISSLNSNTNPNLPGSYATSTNSISALANNSLNNATVKLPTNAAENALTNDVLLLISAYLHLLYRVSISCGDARAVLRSRLSKDQETLDILPLLFKVLEKNVINDAVFDALKPFASLDICPNLDHLVVNKFDEVLNSLQDTQAFVELMELIISKSQEHSVVATNVANGTAANAATNTTASTATAHPAPSSTTTSATRFNQLAVEAESRPGKSLPLYINFIIRNILVGTSQIGGDLAIKTAIQHSCLKILQTLLSKSPVDPAFKLCFEPKVYGSIFDIVTAGDAVIELEENHPLVDLVCLSINIVSALLQLGTGPAWSFDKAVLYHLQVVPHIALYIGSGLKQLSLSSIKLLILLDQSPEFKPSISRQSRVLSALSSTTESARIRVDIMTCLRDPYSDMSVKIAILQMILKELLQMETARYAMTVGHHLLGFRQSELGMELKIELDHNIGGILTNTSSFSVICEIMLACLIGGGENTMLLCLSSAIIGTLVKDKLTSKIVLEYLRGEDFFMDVIKFEPVNLNIQNYDLECEYRSTMLEIWALELQECQRKLLLTVETNYLTFLAPRIFSMLNFTNLPGSAVTLRCLKAWCALVPIMINVKSDKNHLQTGPAFISRVMKLLICHLPEYSRLDTEFAKPVAELLVLLLDKCRYCPDEVMTLYINELFRVTLSSIQPSQSLAHLRSELYSIASKCMKMALESKKPTNHYSDYVQLLLANGPRLFGIVCDDILGRQADELQLRALAFLQLSVATEQQVSTSSIVDILVKQNFISVFIRQWVSTNLTKKDDLGIQLNQVSLALLLQFAQLRQGAIQMIGSGWFELIEVSAGKIGFDLLSVAIKVVIALVVTMGAENKPVLRAGNDVLARNSALVDKILLFEPESKLSSDKLTTELARNVRILRAITAKHTEQN